MQNKNYIFAGSDGADDGVNNPDQAQGKSDSNPNGRMSDREAELLKEVMSKKEQIAEQGRKIEKLESSLSAINEMGGLETFKNLLEAKKTEENKRLEESGQWEALKKQMIEEHNRGTEELRSKINALQSEVVAERQRVTELTIGAAFSGSEFLKSKTVLAPAKARIIFGDYFDVDEGGKITAYDKPRGQNNRAAIVNQVGDAVDFETAIERIVNADPDKDSLLRAIGKPGTGSNTAGLGDVRLQEPAKNKSPLEMIAAGLAKLH